MQEPVVIHISMPKDHVEYVLFRIPSFPGDMYSMLGISEFGTLKQRCSSISIPASRKALPALWAGEIA